MDQRGLAIFGLGIFGGVVGLGSPETRCWRWYALQLARTAIRPSADDNCRFLSRNSEASRHQRNRGASVRQSGMTKARPGAPPQGAPGEARYAAANCGAS
jgi:hypothetical protein